MVHGTRMRGKEKKTKIETILLFKRSSRNSKRSIEIKAMLNFIEGQHWSRFLLAVCFFFFFCCSNRIQYIRFLSNFQNESTGSSMSACGQNSGIAICNRRYIAFCDCSHRHCNCNYSCMNGTGVRNRSSFIGTFLFTPFTSLNAYILSYVCSQEQEKSVAKYIYISKIYINES